MLKAVDPATWGGRARERLPLAGWFYWKGFGFTEEQQEEQRELHEQEKEHALSKQTDQQTLGIAVQRQEVFYQIICILSCETSRLFHDNLTLFCGSDTFDHSVRALIF